MIKSSLMLRIGATETKFLVRAGQAALNPACLLSARSPDASGIYRGCPAYDFFRYFALSFYMSQNRFCECWVSLSVSVRM